MKVPVGELDWFDIWLGIIFVIVVGQTSSCAIEITEIKNKSCNNTHQGADE